MGASGAVRNNPYLRMLFNPFEREYGTRYPDDTIIPTSMVHLVASDTYTVADGTALVRLKAKVITSNPASWSTYTRTTPTTLANNSQPGYAIDYGVPQTTWQNLSSVDRTLAYGVRVRITALPSSTFLPSGTIYFLQVQEHEAVGLIASLALDEANAIQAVTASKGFSMTVNELAKLPGGAAISGLPQGPMSFVFSDTGSVQANAAGNQYDTTMPSGVVSASPVLVVAVYGAQVGLGLRFDYAHHIEYVPTVAAAGLVNTAVALPSASVRELIARGAAAFQDRLLGGTTSADFMRAMGSALQFAQAGVEAVAGSAPQWLRFAASALA